MEDNPEDPYDPINQPLVSKRKSGIRDLIHEVEELEYFSKLYNLSPLDRFCEINGVNRDEINNELNEVDKLFDDMLKSS